MQMMFGKLVLVMCSVATIKRAFCSVGMKMGLKAKCSLKEKVIRLFFVQCEKVKLLNLYNCQLQWQVLKAAFERVWRVSRKKSSHLFW